MKNIIKVILIIWMIFIYMNKSYSFIFPESTKSYPDLNYIEIDWNKYWPYNFLNVQDLWENWVTFSYYENWKWYWYYKWEFYWPFDESWFWSMLQWWNIPWVKYRPNVTFWKEFYYKSWEKYFWENNEEITLNSENNNIESSINKSDVNEEEKTFKVISWYMFNSSVDINWKKYWPYDVLSWWYDLWENWFWFSYSIWNKYYANINWKIIWPENEYITIINLWEEIWYHFWWYRYMTDIYKDWKIFIKNWAKIEIKWITAIKYTENNSEYFYYNWKKYWPYKSVSIYNWKTKWLVLVKYEDNKLYVEIQWKDYYIDWANVDYIDLWDDWFAIKYEKHFKDYEKEYYLNINWINYWPYDSLDNSWLKTLWNNKLLIYSLEWWTNLLYINRHWDYYIWKYEIIDISNKNKINTPLSEKTKNQIDKLILNLHTDKLNKINIKLEKIDLKNQKYNKQKNLIEYIKLKIKQKLEN